MKINRIAFLETMNSQVVAVLMFLVIGLIGGYLITTNFLIEEKPAVVEIADVDTTQIISEARLGYMSKDSVDKLIASIKPEVRWRDVTWEKPDEPEADTSKHIYKLEIEVENEGDVPIAKKDTVVNFEGEGEDVSGIPYTFSARLRHKCKYIYPPANILDNEYDLFYVKATFTYQEPKPPPWFLEWGLDDLGRALIISAVAYGGYKYLTR